MEAIQMGKLMISGNFAVYLNPEDAVGSTAVQMLNPCQQFPTQDCSKRAFSTQTHAMEQGFTDLTADEMYTLTLAADMGANFYARENNPHVQ
jgi:hypothetical protein